KKMIRTTPTKARRLPLPLGSQSVAAAATVTISARPQVLFKPKRLLVVGAGLLINDIKVGNSSQLVQAGSIPNEAFFNVAVDAYVDFDTVQPATDFIVVVNNPTGAAVTFAGVVIGLCAIT